MDAESDSIYMQNLHDYVFDESKIVTYKWLSNNLSIHINKAKKLIEYFVADQSKKSNKNILVKTFFVSGILKDDKGMVSTIVKEEDLPSLKKTLKSVLSEHIYSVQKGSSPTDMNALFLAGEHDDVCIGIIKNSSISKRTFDELSSLRLGGYPKSICSRTSKQSSNSVSTNSILTKDVNSSKTFLNNQKETFKREPSEKNDAFNGTDKSDSIPPPAKPKPSKGSIAGFFSNQMSNPKPKVDKKTEVKKPSKEEKGTLSETLNTNGIKKETSPMKSMKSPMIKHQETVPTKTEVKITTKDTTNSKSLGKASAKLPSSKKAPSKKRKRIQTLDSDSEEENADEIFAPDSPEPARSPLVSDDEDVIPATPEVVKISNKAPLNSRKRKKTVDKTFMDENGYIVTKKEDIFESCSDDNDEIENQPVKSAIISVKKVEEKEENKTQSLEMKSKAKKKTSPKESQGKQQSLMNFFKKANK